MLQLAQKLLRAKLDWRFLKKRTFIVIFTLFESRHVLHSQNRNSKINRTRKIYVVFFHTLSIYIYTHCKIGIVTKETNMEH